MKKLWHYKLTTLVTFIILVGMLMPGDSVPSIPIPGLDKVIHMLMFLGLTSTFYLEHFYVHSKKPSYLSTILVLFLFGIATELLQGSLTASRMCDPLDLLADMTGVAVALLFSPFLEKGLTTCMRYIKSK